VSATDAWDPAPVIAATPESSSKFPIGTTLVRVSARDRAGNRTEDTFLVTVTLDQFTEPPTLITPHEAHVSGRQLAVSFELPERAIPQSVKLSFTDNHISVPLTLSAIHETEGCIAWNWMLKTLKMVSIS
jgi:hypothetical protein